MKTKLPTPQRLPSGQYRCQVMVARKRVSVVDAAPDVCQAKAVALRAGLIEQLETPKDRITLDAAISKYIEERRAVLSPATIMGYKGIQKNRFKSLMTARVRDIDKAALQKAISDDAKTCSAKTLKNSIGLVAAVLSDYKDINTKGLKYPQKRTKEHAYLDATQIVELITACQGNIAEIPILLAVWLGLRRSEIMGLQWESIDFCEKKLKIEHALVPNENGEYVEKSELKNASSRRVLSCPDYILTKLESYQPDISKRNGRVFKMDPSVIYNNLKKISERSGIPFVGVHGLRHTNASVMLSLGIVDKIAMKRGGWATDNTMKSVYQHVFSSDRDTADDMINAYFDSIVDNANKKIAHEITHAKS